MTATELGQALDAIAQPLIAKGDAAPPMTTPLATIVGNNVGYVFGQGLFTVCVFIGRDPEIPGT